MKLARQPIRLLADLKELKVARLFGALFFIFALTLSSHDDINQAHAKDRLTVRGNYYRETSTRVLQPMVTFRKQLPDERFEIETEYLLDAISSASIGAGAAQLGGDKVFTELRHETTGRIRGQFNKVWKAGTSFRYSTETDYISRNAGFFLARDLFQKSATLGLSYNLGIDRVFRIRGFGDRLPYASSGTSNLLRSHYWALSYSHILTKKLLAGLSFEASALNGPQDNPYRRVRNGQFERHPLERQRFAPSLWANWSFANDRMVLEGRFRNYWDSWNIRSNNIDLRLHVRVLKTLRMRARYRFYGQSEAYFWQDSGMLDPTNRFGSDDPKMDDFRSHTPGLELTYELHGLSRLAGLGWLKGGYLQANYNHIFVRCTDLSATCSDQDFGYGKVRSTRFGDARLGSLAFSMEF